MPKKPHIRSAQTVARSRLFEIESLELTFSNGTEVSYERLVSASGSGAVIIVPLLDAHTLLLIREYCAGTHRYELGLPKGRVEAGEEVLAAANRELMEEVGYGARELQVLRDLTIAPAYFSHATTVVVARDLYPQRRDGDEPEPIEVVQWPMAGLLELAQSEQCSEARSLAALFLVREHLDAGAL